MSLFLADLVSVRYSFFQAETGQGEDALILFGWRGNGNERLSHLGVAVKPMYGFRNDLRS